MGLCVNEDEQKLNSSMSSIYLASMWLKLWVGGGRTPIALYTSLRDIFIVSARIYCKSATLTIFVRASVYTQGSMAAVHDDTFFFEYYISGWDNGLVFKFAQIQAW